MVVTINTYLVHHTINRWCDVPLVNWHFPNYFLVHIVGDLHHHHRLLRLQPFYCLWRLQLGEGALIHQTTSTCWADECDCWIFTFTVEVEGERSHLHRQLHHSWFVSPATSTPPRKMNCLCRPARIITVRIVLLDESEFHHEIKVIEEDKKWNFIKALPEIPVINLILSPLY